MTWDQQVDEWRVRVVLMDLQGLLAELLRTGFSGFCNVHGAVLRHVSVSPEVCSQLQTLHPAFEVVGRGNEDGAIRVEWRELDWDWRDEACRRLLLLIWGYQFLTGDLHGTAE